MTCPFLDRMAERCLIYEVRPVACRTYGFYRDRDRGLFCREMQAQDERGDWDGVIWGNAAAVEAKLDELDERKDIDAWFASEGA
jgi:Fe-S-cluster containining protein